MESRQEGGEEAGGDEVAGVEAGGVEAGGGDEDLEEVEGRALVWEGESVGGERCLPLLKDFHK